MCLKEKMEKLSLLTKLPGCIFNYNGSIPESAYSSTTPDNSIERAIYDNDENILNEHVKDGQNIDIHLKIGEMTCLEYASLKGYKNVLSLLLNCSPSRDIIREYFALEDVADRAQMISKNKDIFFGERAVMVEVNRYIACLYTTIIYDQPACLSLFLDILGRRDLSENRFFSSEEEKFNALSLARYLGFGHLSNRHIDMDV
ncbi:hypothetical protein HELRODRAFT_194729 [Helobdella robusta]|uniref:Uncharacterized protein n=1 Tax=Helobdella robusta TaxID=6412 RepID=T1FWC8_HELRO|nr:hypothetical protein HELRODRAFT_194729 [Helobdella robusta]ESN90027.1 hypothetical protein HELRODRAFT_194729 [Helobdella robusta]